MKAIQTELGHIPIKDFLNAVAKEKATDIEELIAQLSEILIQKKIPEYSEREQDLIHRLKNGGPSEEILKKQVSLLEKSVQGILTKAEHQEMMALMPDIDNWNIERAKLLIELANYWKISVQEVIERIHLKAAPVIYA